MLDQATETELISDLQTLVRKLSEDAENPTDVIQFADRILTKFEVQSAGTLEKNKLLPLRWREDWDAIQGGFYWANFGDIQHSLTSRELYDVFVAIARLVLDGKSLHLRRKYAKEAKDLCTDYLELRGHGDSIHDQLANSLQDFPRLQQRLLRCLFTMERVSKAKVAQTVYAEEYDENCEDKLKKLVSRTNNRLTELSDRIGNWEIKRESNEFFLNRFC